MPGTELAVVRDEPAAVAQRDIVDGWVERAASVFKLADHICDTDFVPDAYRGNAPAVAAAILAGRELGIGPMTSLRHVQVVKGAPSLSAEYKRARVLAAGHEFAILEINTQRCRVRGKRRGSSEPPLEIKFDMDDAKRAGLLNPSRSGKPGAWQTRPRRMLFARAASELCDLMFSDVVNGLATTDLLAEGTGEDAFAGYDETDAQEPPKTSPRTARRKTAAAGDDTQGQRPAGNQAARPEGADDSTAQDARPRAAGAAPSRGAQPLPPLPGEEDEAPAAAAPDETPASGPAAAAGPGEEPDETDYDTAGTVTTPQITAIWTVLSTVYKFSKDEKDQARAVCAHIAGHPLESTRNMSRNEARAVLDTLASWREIAERHDEQPREFLIELLATAEKAGDGGD